MYTSASDVNTNISANAVGGLFPIIDSATISNITIKNSYVNLGENGRNFQFGLLSSFGKDYEADAINDNQDGITENTRGDNISYINNCIAANNYIYKLTNDNSAVLSGVLLGGTLVGSYIIQNCLIYGNIAKGNHTTAGEHDIPVIGRAKADLNATGTSADGTGWTFTRSDKDYKCVKTVLENSIVLDTPLFVTVNGNSNFNIGVLSCKQNVNCLKNVYADLDLDNAAIINTNFNKECFLSNGSTTITESDVIGNNAVTNAPNLLWGVDWFVPTTYSGKATPFEFTQVVQNALLNLINGNQNALLNLINGNQNTLKKLIKNNATAINDNVTAIKANAAAINSQKITSYRTTSKYTFDYNAMYLITSNSGDADITLYNSSTGAVVVDGDGNNLPSSSFCLLILPKETDGTNGAYRTCMFIGLTGTFSIVNPNVAKSLQFHVTSGNIHFTPPYSATVFKIAF